MHYVERLYAAYKQIKFSKDINTHATTLTCVCVCVCIYIYIYIYIYI